MRAIRACAALAALASGAVVASAIPAHADEPGVSADADASVSVSVGPVNADTALVLSIAGLLDLNLDFAASIGG